MHVRCVYPWLVLERSDLCLNQREVSRRCCRRFPSIVSLSHRKKGSNLPTNFLTSKAEEYKYKHLCTCSCMLLHEAAVKNALGREPHAHDQSAGSQRKRAGEEENEYARFEGCPAKTRRLYPCLYNDTQKAELGFAEGRQSAADIRYRGDGVYSGHRSQSARAFRCSRSWGARQRPPRCPLPYRSGYAGYAGCGRSQAGAFEIRIQKTEVILFTDDDHT